jgi:hypothetical protein
MFIDEVKKIYQEIHSDGVINIQNISDYISSNLLNKEIYLDDIFSFKLPFDATWLEFKMPQYFILDVKHLTNPSFFEHYGILAREIIKPKICTSIEIYSIIPLTDKKPKLIATIPIPIDLKTGKFIHNDFDYIIENDFYNYIKTNCSGDPMLIAEEFTSRILIRFGIFLNFYHCKNVKLNLIKFPEKVIKKRLKSKDKKNYFQKYYTLSIEPMKKVLESYGSKESGIKHAFHIVPGHFKEYKKGEDGTGGLFGKLEGVWFWNNHVRGDKKIGEIQKNYDINLKSFDESKMESRI